MKTKAIGYIRVSTSEQALEGVSLANQRNKIETFANLKDFDLVEIIADEGSSGKNLNREGIRNLLNLIKTKKIDTVIVYKLDRLTRKTKDLLFLFEDVFNKNSINFVSLCENVDTSTATGKFFLTLLGALAQMERDQISERTSDALSELKRQNRRLGSPDKTPFGFTQVKRNGATMSDLKPVPEQIKTLREIHRMRKEKQSLSAIGKKYNMAKSTVKYVLDNPVYKELGILSFS